MTDVRCYYCGCSDRELRPYGPGGSRVCHPCVTSNPERNRQAQNAFGALLDAAENISPTGIVAIGEPDGPRPFAPEDIGPPFCSACGGDRGPREPADADGLGCLENIYHTEDLEE